jgi:tRNA dimethylallyltransferase
MKKQRIFVIGGPTASGKTALAIQLAEAINGSIVNGDAIQVYKDLRILSARPSLEEQKGIPHYLFGFVDAWTNYSLAEWLNDVKKDVSHLNNPIIVGGTGMYLDALINGVNDIPEIPHEIRQKVREMPLEEVRKMMKDYPLQDSQRVRRALEVKLATGKSLKYFHDQPKTKALDADFCLIHVLPDRERVYENCAKRFELMLEEGALEEVKNLNKIKATGGVLKAIGVSEIKSFLNNEIDKETMIDKAVTATRQYAKRQMTWFRHHGVPQHVITNPNEIEIKNITK